MATQLLHRGSGRNALLVCQASWLEERPVELSGRPYILVAASENSRAASDEAARRWIDAGASYVCAWGPSAEDTEEAFDYASFLESLGPPLDFTLMTTSHANESLDEALWFAFYTAAAPENLAEPLKTVVILVDTPALAQRCEAWIRNDRE